MILVHPFYTLLVLLLGIPLVIAYLRRPKMPRESVTTAWLWDDILAQRRLRTRWLPWRDRATLALNLLILFLVAVAAADPRFAFPQRLVVVVDNQTPPAEAEAGGIEAVKAAARGIIDAKAPEDEMLVIAAAEPLVVPSGWTRDRQELLAAVDAIVERPGPADREALASVAAIALGHNDLDQVRWVGPDPSRRLLGDWHADSLPPRRVKNLSALLLTAAVVLLALEWCLVQRRWLS